MFTPDARTIVTPVQNAEPFWQWPVRFLPHEHVRAVIPPIDAKYAVTADSRSGPNMTAPEFRFVLGDRPSHVDLRGETLTPRLP